MLVEVGETVHVIERRAFENDARRHLIGRVVAVDQQGMRIACYAFVFDQYQGSFVRKPDPRTRVVSFDGRYLINILPHEVDLEKVQYVQSEIGLLVTDNKTFRLSVSEFGAKG